MKKLINFYKRLSFFQGAVVATSLTSVVGIAASVTGLHTFNPGATISSSQMNDNFTILKNAVESTSSQQYVGTYNANSGIYPTAAAIAGDYYIVSTAGTISSIAYNVGDWIIYNGSSWSKIPSSATITTVFGRTGAIAAVEGDYTLNQLLDVDLTTAPAFGEYLRYDGTHWVADAMVEADPTVQSFAKMPLPSCAAGEVLKSTGSTFSCVTDNAGAPAFTGAANKVVMTNGIGDLTTSSVTNTELGYLSGTTSNLQTQINAQMIAPGTTSQYYRGDKTWQNFDTSVLALPLAGLTNTMGALTASDTVLGAFGKMQAMQADVVSKSNPSMIMSTVTFSGPGSLVVPAPIATNEATPKSYVDAAIDGLIKQTINLTAVGQNAGTTSTGSNNSFFGYYAGNANGPGTFNTYIGTFAGKYNSGNNNTAVGSGSLSATGIKAMNTAVGTNALAGLTTGSANVVLGYGAGTNLTTGSGNIVVGGSAGPTAAAENNITIGNGAGMGLTGSGNVLIGKVDMTGTPSTTDTIILATAGMSPMERMRITNTGNVGIGTTTPAYTLHVNGQVAGTAAYITASDLRYKKDISRMTNSLDKLLSITGVSYKFRNDEFPESKFSKRRELGVIAQNVEKVFPEAVSKDSQGFRSVAYTMLISPIIEAIREVNSKTKRLEDENKMLKSYLCERDPSAPFCDR